MEKIDLNTIRGGYVEVAENGVPIAGGDDTIESIKMVAEKVNEIIETLNRYNLK
jgi:hypothetical protein